MKERFTVGKGNGARYICLKTESRASRTYHMALRWAVMSILCCSILLQISEKEPNWPVNYSASVMKRISKTNILH